MAGGRGRPDLGNLSVAGRFTPFCARLALPAALMLAAASPVAAAQLQSAADARTVLRTVLAFEARVQQRSDHRPPLCISRRLSAAHVPFNHERQPPRTRPYDWWRLADVHPGYIHLTDRLSPLEEARVQASERAAWLSLSSQVRGIESRWLRSPLHFCAPGFPSQHLEVSEAVIVGDFAFVSVDFQCGLCGVGTLLALRRTASGWQIVAGTTQWQS